MPTLTEEVETFPLIELPRQNCSGSGGSEGRKVSRSLTPSIHSSLVR